MTEEIWKPVVNFDGYYEVSNKGRVRSVDDAGQTIDEELVGYGYPDWRKMKNEL